MSFMDAVIPPGPPLKKGQGRHTSARMYRPWPSLEKHLAMLRESIGHPVRGLPEPIGSTTNLARDPDDPFDPADDPPYTVTQRITLRDAS